MARKGGVSRPGAERARSDRLLGPPRGPQDPTSRKQALTCGCFPRGDEWKHSPEANVAGDQTPIALHRKVTAGTLHQLRRRSWTLECNVPTASLGDQAVARHLPLPHGPTAPSEPPTSAPGSFRHRRAGERETGGGPCRHERMKTAPDQKSGMVFRGQLRPPWPRRAPCERRRPALTGDL